MAGYAETEEKGYLREFYSRRQPHFDEFQKPVTVIALTQPLTFNTHHIRTQLLRTNEPENAREDVEEE